MKLPEKYKGATEGPWRIESGKFIAATTPGFHVDLVARFNISGRVESDEANARLIADAPMLACRVAELEAALKEISELSAEADGKQWYDDWNDYGSYRWKGNDGVIRTSSVDSGNSGDVHDHGLNQGMHVASVIARKALAANDNAACAAPESQEARAAHEELAR